MANKPVLFLGILGPVFERSSTATVATGDKSEPVVESWLFPQVSAVVYSGAAALTIQSSVAAAGTVATQGTAALTVESSAVSAAIVAPQGAAALTAQTNIWISPTEYRDVTSGVNRGLGISGITIYSGVSALTAQSTLTSGAVRIAVSDSTATVQSTLTSTAVVAASGASVLTVQSSLVSAATVIKVSASALTVQSSLTAGGVMVALGATALSAQSSLSATGSMGATSVLSVQSTLTATSTLVTTGASALTAQSIATSTATRTAVCGSDLSVTSTMSATGITAWACSTTMTVGSTIAVTAIQVNDSASSMSAHTNSDSTVRVFRNVWFFSGVSQDYLRGRRLTHDSWFVPISVGMTLCRKSGVWHTYLNPADYDLTGADVIYRGGRTYPISSAELSDLNAAGYGTYCYYELQEV